MARCPLLGGVAGVSPPGLLVYGRGAPHVCGHVLARVRAGRRLARVGGGAVRLAGAGVSGDVGFVGAGRVGCGAEGCESAVADAELMVLYRGPVRSCRAVVEPLHTHGRLGASSVALQLGSQ
eukprot:15433902-Alexandrium_andersonii.AAC.1